jgi:DNA repair protein RadC
VINIKSFERSPQLAEIKVSYRRRGRADNRQTQMPWMLVTPASAADYLRSIWNQDTIELTEDFIMVCLHTAREVLGWVKVASGGMDTAAVDVRVVLAIALQTASSALIFAHNHPSGSLQPSDQDRLLTQQLKEAAELLRIAVLDHIILTKDGVLSFLDEGLL